MLPRRGTGQRSAPRSLPRGVLSPCASSCLRLLVLLEGVSDRWAKPCQIAVTKLVVNRDPDEPRS